MLKGLLKHRPKQLMAVYVESQQVEVLRAHRKWRSWQIDPSEKYAIPEGEALFDYLQRLNLRARARNGTALVLFLSRSFYSFHREHYPAALGEHLEETLAFDWQENTFHENGRSLHFFGPAVPVDRHLSVPVFTMQLDMYEKFQQALGGGTFDTFAVIPSAIIYNSFLSTIISQENPSHLEIIGRRISHNQLEIHRFYNKALLDSVLIGKNFDYLRLFREGLNCLGEDGETQDEVRINLLCTSTEAEGEFSEEWTQIGDLPIEILNVPDSFLSHWVKHLLGQDRIQTFDKPLYLKPWKVPRFVWMLLSVVGVYAAFFSYQLHTVNQLKEVSKQLKKQNAQLETQWKPIEQLQTRIAKFQEDQKTLSEFNLEGYPLLEILTHLTQLTPDDTWLNYLSLRKGQLMLRGESKSAIKYLSDLAKVEGFSDVRFASPVTRNPSSDQERFNVQLQLDADKLRKTLENVLPEKMDDTDKAGIVNLGDSPPSESLGPAPTPEVAVEPAPEEGGGSESPPEEDAGFESAPEEDAGSESEPESQDEN